MELSLTDFMAATTTGLQSQFITATVAARQMAIQGCGVILGLTSGSSTRQGPMMGGTGAGPTGVRVVGLWTAGRSSPPIARGASRARS